MPEDSEKESDEEAISAESEDLLEGQMSALSESGSEPDGLYKAAESGEDEE